MFAKRRYYTPLLIVLTMSMMTLYCTSTPKILNNNYSDSVVGTVGPEVIEYEDLMQGFMSGGVNQDPTAEELKEFLPIYLNYRAKLLSAREAGYFENENILDEHALYAKQAAYAYWLDREIKPTVFEQFKTVNGEAIIEFFRKVRNTYESMTTIHMVLDGAGYHRSEEVVKEAKNLRIKLHYLPPYSPNLNPIERLWKVMNEYARNNEYFAKAKEFREKIDHFLDVTLPEIGAALASRINDNFQRLNPAS